MNCRLLFTSVSCADPESFCQRGSNFDNILLLLLLFNLFIYLFIYLLFDKEREDPGTTISGLSSARQRNAIKWRFAGVPMMAKH